VALPARYSLACHSDGQHQYSRHFDVLTAGLTSADPSALAICVGGLKGRLRRLGRVASSLLGVTYGPAVITVQYCEIDN
jgi:hypothetical protein